MRFFPARETLPTEESHELHLVGDGAFSYPVQGQLLGAVVLGDVGSVLRRSSALADRMSLTES